MKSDREEATWSQKFTFHHVTGDFWIIYAEMYATFDDTALRCQFKFGVDGRPAGLEIEFRGRGAQVAEAVILFEKLE